MPDRTARLLRATLDPGPAGVSAWRELLEDTPFDVIDAATTRLLPRIYLTLRRHGDAVPELGRLKGAYRATWARNTVLVDAALPLVEALATAGIRYRLVKGAALCALDGLWGARTMGDVDVLVGRRDAEQVTELMLEHGFQPRIASTARSPRAVAGAWDSPSGGLVDLALTGRRDRRSPGLALRAPARWPTVSGVPVATPPAEVLALLALEHGRAGVAVTDDVQALVDLAVLLPRCDPQVLRRAAEIVGITDYLASAVTRLAHAGVAMPAQAVDLGTVRWRDRPRIVERRLEEITAQLGRVAGLPELARQRRPRPRDLPLAWTSTDGRRRAYAAWLGTGQLRPVEALATSRGGFLASPPQELPVNTALRLERAGGRTTSRATVGPSVAVEFRARVRVPPVAYADDGQGRLLLQCHPADTPPQMVFVNGRMFGWIRGGTDGATTLDVPTTDGELEISLRGSDSRTGSPLESLTVTVVARGESERS